METTKKVTINNSFSTLAHWGLLVSDLNDSDIVLFLAMQTRYQFFKHKNLDYFESQESLSDHLNWSLSKVKRSVKNLKSKGYLTIIKIDMRRSKYVINNPYVKKITPHTIPPLNETEDEFEIFF